MKLNLDFYKEKQEELLPVEKDIISYINENKKENYPKIMEDHNRIQVIEALSQMPENILNWQKFDKDAVTLQMGGSFGEITGMLCDRCLKVIAIEPSYKKAQAILKRYENKENLEIIVGTIGDITLNEKFDYVVIYERIKGEKHLEELVKYAKEALKDDGKIFLATDNRFGIQYWAGKNDLFDTDKDEQLVSEKQIKNILETLKLQYKTYYIFPNYKMPNLIYDESYNISHEDISRNFTCYNENQIINFVENKMLGKMIKEDRKSFNFFANSFLVEISKNQINDEVRYITFTNYRKPEYQTMTVIKESEVEKKAVNLIAQKHIDTIVQNLKYLKNYDIDSIEKDNNGRLISTYIKDYPRLDIKLEQLEDLQDLQKQFKPYIDMLYKNSIDYKDVKNEEMCEAIKSYDQAKLKNLRFLEYGFLDLIPKNCFDINGRIATIDQEWMIKYIPVEYLIYRAIRNSRLVEKFSEEIYNIYNLTGYEELFENIEKEFRDKIVDSNILSNVFNKHITTKKELIDTLQHYKNLNEIAQTEKQNMQNEIQELRSELNYMINSKSWKITKPLRAVRRISRKKE